MEHTKSTSHFLDLSEGAVLRLRDAAGTRISVWSGCLWITQESDARDLVLLPGESCRLAHDGLAVVEVMEAAEFRVDVVNPELLCHVGPMQALAALYRAQANLKARPVFGI